MQHSVRRCILVAITLYLGTCGNRFFFFLSKSNIRDQQLWYRTLPSIKLMYRCTYLGVYATSSPWAVAWILATPPFQVVGLPSHILYILLDIKSVNLFATSKLATE